jgi:hypothetical protein
MRALRLVAITLCAAALTGFLKADPRPATTPSSAPATGCRVKVKSVKVDVVTLRAPRAPAADPADDSTIFSGLHDAQSPREGDRRTDEKFLVVQVEVTNAGREKCLYHSLAGSDEKCPGMVVLHDDARHVYALANFGDLDVAGAVKGARTLKPGGSLIDVLVFEVPPKSAKGLRLLIPKDNVGCKQHLDPLAISIEQ